MDSLNSAGNARARSLIGEGKVDEGAWSFSAADGDALLGKGGNDWATYGSYHLGIDSGEPEKTKARYKYPFGKAGKIYHSALRAIRSRSSQQGAEAIFAAAGKLLDSIEKKDKPAAGRAPNSFRATGKVEFLAAGTPDGNEGAATDQAPERPKFAIHGYTGAPMQLEGFYSPVVVDLKGLVMPTATMPVLRQHDPNRIVGQTDTHTMDASGLHMTGKVTGSGPDSKEVVDHAKDGFNWQASIGADITRREFLEAGKKATVNDREVTGPMVIVRGSILKEVSFVPIGADGQTSVTVAASSLGSSLKGAMSMFETWLQAKGFDPAAISEEQSTFLRGMYDKEIAAASGGGSGGGNGSSSTDSVDAIIAEQRSDDERITEITRLTRKFVAEHPRRVDTIERLARAAIESKMKPAEYELNTLRLMRPDHPNVNARPALAEVASAEVVEAAVCASLQLPDIEKSFKPEALDVVSSRFPRGIGLRETFKLVATMHGYSGLSDGDHLGILRAAYNQSGRPDIRAEGGFSTVEISGILSNVMNKFLVIAFNAVENSWATIAAVRPVRDFKQTSSYALVGDVMYEQLGPGGEIKSGKLNETTYHNQAQSFAKMMALTRQDIINDDLGALAQVPRRLGRGAALKINDVFWKAFLANPTGGNGNAFFSAGNANYISGVGTVLSATSLQEALTSFRKQTDPDGFPLGITPKFLLVPPELEVTADQLMHSTLIVSNTAGGTAATPGPYTTLPNMNVWQNKYEPVTSVYLSNANYSGYSATAWYLLASPEDLATIEICFLNGRQTPIIESAEADFDVLGVRVRGFHDFGVSVQEYRSGTKAAGA